MLLTDKQQIYLHHCDHRWNVKVGAVGSGKSYVDIAITIPQRIYASQSEGLLVMMGNTRGTLERNILEPMRQLYPEMIGAIHGDNTINMFGKKVYALGADNKKHVQRIQGATFEYVYGDEVTTWAQDVFEMLKSRLRCEHSCFDGTCNPDNPRHWFKQFIDSDADVYCQQYQIDDGVLPAHIVTELKKEYAGTMYYDRFILGKWVQAEGLVYPMFSEANITDMHGTEGEWYLSVDYGTSHPMAMGLWRVYQGTATMEYEYYYSGEAGQQKTDAQYYDDLLGLVGDIPVKRIIIDPSAASFKATIREGGKYKTVDANNAVMDGIRTTATMISQHKILIHSSCTHTLEEFGLYRWDEKKAEDAVIKENDHEMDQMRYLVMTGKLKEKSYTPVYMRGVL